MSAKKKILAAASYVMVAAMAIGGTVAYYTAQTETENNIMVSGIGVDIELIEQERTGVDGELVDFQDGKVLMPISDAQGEKDKWGMPVIDGYVDKIVTVENTGENDAYVRVFVAIPAQLEGDAANENILHWNYGNRFDSTGTSTYNAMGVTETVNLYDAAVDQEEVVKNFTIDGIAYNIYSFTYLQPLKDGETTDYATLTGCYLDADVTYSDGKYYVGDTELAYDLSKGVVIPVMAQAVQTTSFESAAEAFAASGLPTNPWAETPATSVVRVDGEEAALATAAKAGGDVILVDDVAVTDNIIQNGGVISGAYNTIDGTAYGTAGERSDCVITTTGGTIANLTVSGGFRGIGAGSSGAYAMTEDLYLKDVTVTGATYGINIGKGNGYWLYVEDSTICDWNSYADLGGAQFTNCTFTSEGNYYACQRISANATVTFTNCNFEQNTYDAENMKYYLDSYGNGTIVFENCYMDGVLITAENVGTLFTIESENGVYVTVNN